MESLLEILKGIQTVVWGPLTIFLLLAVGFYYTIRLKGVSITAFPKAVK